MEYTDEQVTEIKKCYNDPIYFFSTYFNISHPNEGKILYQLHPIQKVAYNHLLNYQNSIFNCSRQTGFTTLLAGYLLHYSLFNINKTNLVITHKIVQREEIIRKIMIAHENLPKFFQISILMCNKQCIKFDNNTVTYFSDFSASTGRELMMNNIIIDGIYNVTQEKFDEMMYAIWPTAYANKSKFIIASTPGFDNPFDRLWEKSINGENTFVPMIIPWHVIPHRDTKFKNKTIELMGENIWNNQYRCEPLE